MPIVFDTFLVKLPGNGCPGGICFVQEFLPGTLPCPLKRRKRLGDKKGSAGHNLDPACALFFGNRLVKQRRNFVAQLPDAFNIFLCLHRKPQHEIKLDPGPAPFKGQPGTC